MREKSCTSFKRNYHTRYSYVSQTLGIKKGEFVRNNSFGVFRRGRKKKKKKKERQVYSRVYLRTRCTKILLKILRYNSSYNSEAHVCIPRKQKARVREPRFYTIFISCGPGLAPGCANYRIYKPWRRFCALFICARMQRLARLTRLMLYRFSFFVFIYQKERKKKERRCQVYTMYINCIRYTLQIFSCKSSFVIKGFEIIKTEILVE